MVKDHSWNRRDFIAKPLTWLAATRLLGNSGFLFAEQTKPSSSAARKPIFRTLGKTGISLPIVSMGVMRADIPALINRSYEVGIRYFDTAAGYQQGRNEEMVGSAIKQLGVRDQVTIATKVPLPPALRENLSALTSAEVKDKLQETFNGSLKRLQMDHVDILHLHGADSAEMVKLDGALEAMSALKKDGKARFLGVSTHSHQEAVLNEVMRLGVHDVVLLAINSTMASNRGLLDAIDRASTQGIGLVAMKTMAGGMERPASPPTPRPASQSAAQPPSQTPPRPPQPPPPGNPTALLKWVLRHESITTAIAGFTTFEQIEQNFTVAYDLEYSDAERRFLADKSFVIQAEFCQQCGECRSSCPQRADIPTLMRSHMYGLQYRDAELANYTLASIAAGKGLEACANCESCQASCSKTVNIARKIAQLKAFPLPGLPVLS